LERWTDKEKLEMPKRPAHAETLVQTLSGEIETLTKKMSHPTSDKVMNGYVEELFETTASLANVPVQNFLDILIKMDVLCRRLREDLHPDRRGEILTYLLAESIRDECLLISKNSNVEH
jgi:hypothetical protein